MFIRIALWAALLLVVVSPDKAPCQDFLHGEILAVDKENMQITLRPGGSTADAVAEITVRLPAKIMFSGQSAKMRLPGCVVPGNRVRVWGKASIESWQFTATDIRGCGGDACNDPTGVRIRLFRHQVGRENGRCGPGKESAGGAQ